ncbi:MAG: sterol desaturase family protein [Pseudomonas sp.]|uniref:sterol desaturase family protein n=1 Tax=Pseudomonas sp. TaxID=306 RepID=UPI00120097B2|nr:sterol desaturase family protein [Pseudomonas sp.]RZI76914.1 MAG: sterol desaturase family protein [Pseudomonas sp.]
MDLTTYMAWITVGAFIVLLTEIAAGRHKGIYKRRGEFRLLGLSMAIGRFLLGPIMSIAVAGFWGMALPGTDGALRDLPLWASLPLVVVVTEFCFYWGHRWAHEGVKNRSLLWMLHRTHHSASYMNVAVWMRVNVFWSVVVPTAWTIGLAIHLGLADAAGLTVALIAVWNIVTHANFRWDDAVRRHRAFGPAFRALEHVIVSPGMHHTHHGFGRDGASYRNFGVLLSVWDWVFGTLHIPEGRPWRYGLPGHDAHWLEELAYPVVRMGRPATDASLLDSKMAARNP